MFEYVMAIILPFGRKRVVLILGLLLLFSSQLHAAVADKTTVVASIFPLYDFTSQVGGDLVDVKMMLPPGLEAHGFSPTPHDIIAVQRADIFLYTSDYLEPWAGAVVDALGTRIGRVVEVGKELISVESKHSDHGGHHQGVDPHVWLNPVFAVKMVRVIEAALSEVDPANSAVYKRNSSAYISKLFLFDRQTEHDLQNCQSHTIISGGHFAFGSFAGRYGLTAVSPYKGFSPDAQPSPKAIGRLVKTMRTTGSNVIFHEELIQPKVARIIAGETGGRLLLLHGVHNVSKRELERGETYLSLMQENVKNLKIGLRCQ